MQTTTLTRQFKYNGMTLADPASDMEPRAVARFYAAQYPELLNSLVEGPVTKNGVSTYTFTRQAGGKGANRARAQAPDQPSTGEATTTTIEVATLAHLLDLQVRHFALASVIAGLRRNARTSTHEHLMAVLSGPTMGALLEQG